MNHDALEHESGLRPLGEYPDHCAMCARVASCAHDDSVEIVRWGAGTIARFCGCCGAEETEEE